MDCNRPAHVQCTKMLSQLGVDSIEGHFEQEEPQELCRGDLAQHCPEAAGP